MGGWLASDILRLRSVVRVGWEPGRAADGARWPRGSSCGMVWSHPQLLAPLLWLLSLRQSDSLVPSVSSG
jgi:hypothetical protein